MPATGDEPSKGRLRRGFPINMEGLRIVSRTEFYDLFFADAIAAKLANFTDCVIFEESWCITHAMSAPKMRLPSSR